MAEGTHWREWGKQEKRWRKLRETKRCRELGRHWEGDAVAWSRETGETWWKRLPGIENGMGETGERGRERSQRREDTLLPSTKRRQRGSRAGRARKLSSGNKSKRDSVSFTFLLTDRKIGGKVLYKVKHWCVLPLCVDWRALGRPARGLVLSLWNSLYVTSVDTSVLLNIANAWVLDREDNECF